MIMENTAVAVVITICIISATCAQLTYFRRPDIITTNTRCIACTRTAAFRTNIDGQDTIAQCSSGNDVKDRCTGCCEVYAIYNGRQKAEAASFPGKDGSCICCMVQMM
ncbi:NADH-ubiquinone oxidoreductasesubunit [Dirofilaria immitis]